MLSLGLGGASISSDEFENESESGGGFSAQVGWGFSRMFTLLVDASGAVLDSDTEEFVLVHGDLLGRFHFANPSRAWVPFVEGGISARVAGQDNTVIIGENGPQEVNLEISGGGFTFGGGVQYYVAPAWALGASLRFTVGEFSTVKFNNVSIDGFELDATSTRLNFGVTWRPMMGRR
jgi:opacity protein-like surface antigen